MKVCTDACIFGAAVADYFNSQPAEKNILDIGTGTGLLSLMLAQKLTASIDAVEIDEVAFQQAAKNFEASPWADRLTVFQDDAIHFQSNKKYGLIISNPPFFEGDLKSGNQKKDTAKHDITLTLERLLQAIGRNISEDGSFAVLLPFHRTEFFTKLALNKNYRLNYRLLLRHTDMHPFFRSILIFSNSNGSTRSIELSIKDAFGNYTSDVKILMKDYYL